MKKPNPYYIYDRKNICDKDLVLGIDEVGRGCWAGPLVVCGIILKPNYNNDNVKDSKLLSSSKREMLNNDILNNAVDYLILKASPQEVDKNGPKLSTTKLMTKIINTFGKKVKRILVDYEKINNTDYLVESITKGDQISYAIACASIVAKVYRDNLMLKFDAKYPNYGFKNHKGYGTQEHLLNLKKYGPIKNVHRFSYSPVKIVDISFKTKN